MASVGSEVTTTIKSDATVPLEGAPQLERPTDPGLNALTAAEMPVYRPQTAAVPLPPFVRYDGAVDNIGLRTFLMDTSFRDNQNPRTGRNDHNSVSAEHLFPIAVWATGVQPATGQTAREYFTYQLEAGRLHKMIETHGAEFSDPLVEALGALGTKVSDDLLPKTDLRVRDAIRLDRVTAFILMFDRISPCEGFGTRDMEKALIKFREIALS